MDVRLVSQVIRILYGRGHPLHREESGQVGRVGGDENQGEEPPDAAHYPRRGGTGVEVRPLLHQRAHGEPEAVGEGEVVLYDVPGVNTRVGGRPLVGGEPEEVNLISRILHSIELD